MKKLLVIIVILTMFLTNIVLVFASSEGGREGDERVRERNEANQSLQNFAMANPQYAQLVAAAIELNNRNFELGFNANTFIQSTAEINIVNKDLILRTFNSHKIIAFGEAEESRLDVNGNRAHGLLGTLVLVQCSPRLCSF